MPETCPKCGADLVGRAMGSDFDDDTTPVDIRVGARERANETLVENELARARAEADRLALELAAVTGERDELRKENSRLRLALAGRFKRR